MTGYPIPTTVPVTPAPTALALPPREPEPPAWPGWTGVRVAEDHTTQRHCKAAPTDRETGE